MGVIIYDFGDEYFFLIPNEKSLYVKINPAYGKNYAVKPLELNPAKLKGISEKVIVSHHQNNYSGAVKKLNLIQKQLLAMPVSAHPIEYGALKKEELIGILQNLQKVVDSLNQ